VVVNGALLPSIGSIDKISLKMSVWLNSYFAEDQEFKTNGEEFWRSIQDAFRSEVADFNHIYAQSGQPILRVVNGEAGDPNVFRVISGAGDSEQYVQLNLEPERMRVSVSGSFVPSGVPPYRISLDSGGLSLFEGESLVSFEVVTRRALEPLVFPGGLRRVPV
jgi:hypothetical protein